MMEKLRMFFIEGGGLQGANPALYRAAMKADGLIHFFRVQTAVAEDFSRDYQHGDLVAVPGLRGRLAIDVNHIDGNALGGRQCRKFLEHFLA
jgi:hypothetical protein